VTCFRLASLVAFAPLVLTDYEISFEPFYCNAPEKFLFVAQKDAKTLKSVQYFGCQGSVKTRNEPRFFGRDLNEYSVLEQIEHRAAPAGQFGP
jgi:hypothetical protein